MAETCRRYRKGNISWHRIADVADVADVADIADIADIADMI